MTRKEFIEKSLLMGISLPLVSSILMACKPQYLYYPKPDVAFKGTIIIVGAGAAGLSAAYLLKELGIEFIILEAASLHGGRLKKAETFSDFPVDLGAEWIHVNPQILSKIAGKPIDHKRFETIEYNPKTIKTWQNGRLKSHNYLTNFYSEWKFKRSTWFDFFDENIVPQISDSILLNKAVVEIDSKTNRIIAKTAGGDWYEADKLLVTVPIKMLQKE